jgi:hypothetical protein
MGTRHPALFNPTKLSPGISIAGARVFISVRMIVVLIAPWQPEREDTVTAVSKFQEFIWEQRNCFSARAPIDPSSSDGRPAFDTAGGCLGAVGKFDLLMEFEKLLPIFGVQSDHGPLLVGIANKDHAIADRQCAKGLSMAMRPLDSVDGRALPNYFSRRSVNGPYHPGDRLKRVADSDHVDAIG